MSAREVSRFVVIGAGLAGASTAWRLAQRGYEATVVERRVPATPDGSSHGSARIFRYAYEKPLYVRLVQQAARGWAELEALKAGSGGPLLTRTGAVDFGVDRDVPALAAVLAAEGVDHEVLTAAQARERWPQIAFDSPVLHHPQAGVLDPLATVLAMLDAARAEGARVLTGWPVARVERRAAGFLVRAADGRRVEAERVIVAAGGWLPALLGELGLPESFLRAFPPLQVRQENAFHFPYREEVAAAEDWPTVVHKGGGVPVYALPGGRDAAYRGHKVAEFNGGRRLASAARQDGIVDPVNRARVTGFVAHAFPGLAPDPYAEATCLFTNTPAEDFLVDEAEGVTIVSACSGHGAKFAPLLGELAAEAALGGTGVPGEFRVGA